MKKLVLVVVVAAALSLSLSGCSGNDPAPAGTTPASASPTPSGVETDFTEAPPSPTEIPPGEYMLPNLIGFPRDSAISLLGMTGIAPELIVVVEQESTQPAGTVIAMDPPAGAVVAIDTTITLTVAKPIAEATPSPSHT